MIKTKSEKGLNSTNNFHLYLYRLKICICRKSDCVCVCICCTQIKCVSFPLDRINHIKTHGFYTVLYVGTATHSLHFFWIHLAAEYTWYVVKMHIVHFAQRQCVYIYVKKYKTFFVRAYKH